MRATTVGGWLTGRKEFELFACLVAVECGSLTITSPKARSSARDYGRLCWWRNLLVGGCRSELLTQDAQESTAGFVIRFKVAVGHLLHFSEGTSHVAEHEGTPEYVEALASFGGLNQILLLTLLAAPTPVRVYGLPPPTRCFRRGCNTILVV